VTKSFYEDSENGKVGVLVVGLVFYFPVHRQSANNIGAV